MPPQDPCTLAAIVVMITFALLKSQSPDIDTMRTSADWRWIDADCAVVRPPRLPFDIAQTCEV